MAALTVAAGLVTGCAGTAAQLPAGLAADEAVEGDRATDRVPVGSTGRAAGALAETGERLDGGAGGGDI